MKDINEQYFIYSLLQRFWSSSGDFWQYQWNNLLDITGIKKILNSRN